MNWLGLTGHCSPRSPRTIKSASSAGGGALEGVDGFSHRGQACISNCRQTEQLVGHRGCQGYSPRSQAAICSGLHCSSSFRLHDCPQRLVAREMLRRTRRARSRARACASPARRRRRRPRAYCAAVPARPSRRPAPIGEPLHACCTPARAGPRCVRAPALTGNGPSGSPRRAPCEPARRAGSASSNRGSTDPEPATRLAGSDTSGHQLPVLVLQHKPTLTARSSHFHPILLTKGVATNTRTHGRQGVRIQLELGPCVDDGRNLGQGRRGFYNPQRGR